ncbi:biotin/lipoyl-binding protein [Sphingobacterium sp. SRCM116780]|uniref:HlyD family secretion protein n=1 Tax=Sphingobacterium sp. SRCM116780 TaxID=2907623 RepID=UPI001F4636A8|nr:biotin/lipoyl-binding protein [Sphingobacterium sp. SRCM116780]UIR55347.1 biotin/lipoyl-binding protein [Sphingobacterium sp. SRCM116780]
MKKIIYIVGIAVLAQSCRNGEKVKNTFEGKIERDQISVTTKIPGKVHQILVSEGAIVQAGDTLMILEFPEVDAKSAQAKGALDAAQAQYNMAVKGATDNQLKQLRAKRDGLREQYEFAQKSLKRMQNLIKDSLIAQQQYDEVYMKFQGAKNQYLAVQAELADAENGARIEQQHMALGQKERALGAVSEINVATKERYIIAPQNMTVETINLKVGELALAGYSLISGYLIDGTYFRVTIPEKQLQNLTAGSKQELSFPYLNNKKITAEIVSVKALSSYANIATAYPDFEQQESLFEVKLKPMQREDAQKLLTKATFILHIGTTK